MKTTLHRHRSAVSLFGALVSAGIAIAYLFVELKVPSTANDIQISILTYGHSACWILLCGAIVAWWRRRSDLARVLVYGALGAYVLFVLTLLTTRS